MTIIIFLACPVNNLPDEYESYQSSISTQPITNGAMVTLQCAATGATATCTCDATDSNNPTFNCDLNPLPTCEGSRLMQHSEIIY